MPSDHPRPYVPPGDDEPLDAIQEALVRLWVDIIAAEIREELAEEAASSRGSNRHAVMAESKRAG
jgi:hypothetical protein